MKLANVSPEHAPAAAGSKGSVERIVSIRRWTPELRSFEVTRPAGFRFTPGHYARLGLANAGDEVAWRPYSIASGRDHPLLEFLLVRVPGGAFTEAFERLEPGAPILVAPASYGFLTVDQLAPGASLWLLASGTGISAFVSMLRDPATWQRFETVVVAHSVRKAADLAYRDEIAEAARTAAGAGAPVARLHYLPVVTREPGASDLQARLPALIADGRLEREVAAPLDVDTSRVMACGNPAMTREVRALLTERGFRTTRRGVAGQMAFENYW